MSLYNNSHNCNKKSDRKNTVAPEKIVDLPPIDTSKIELFHRFGHERPPVIVEPTETEPTKKLELKYRKDDGKLFSVRPEGDKIHPDLKLIKNKITGNFVFPEKILVGQDFYDSKSGVYTNMLTGGNIWLDARDIDDDDCTIDDFIISYIFKIIEQFPLGRVKFYILDEKGHWCYDRLKHNLNFEGANSFCKNAVDVRTEKPEHFLEEIKKTLCASISQKMSSGINNIKELCNIDPDECISFVIVRDPLDKIGSYWNLLDELTRPGEKAHKCGFRFVIVNQSREDERYSSIELLNSILGHCEIQYQIKQNTFLLSDYFIDPLSIDSTVISSKENKPSVDFAIEGARSWSLALQKLSSSFLEHKELWDKSDKFKDTTKSARISIPVGKHGREIFSLPFSSANDDQSVEGQVINYMVAGTTGSGKSSLMHSIIINGAMTYSPEDLRFWIIDFKNGQESNKYKEANIPHIEMLSSKNTKDDAQAIFGMILNEIKRRKELFEDYGGYITEYNKAMDEQKKPHVPRIIVIIDEVQELFINSDGEFDDWSPAKSLENIAPLCRFAGIHIVLIAQNLAASGRSLVSSYLPSVQGNVAFSMNSDAFSGTFSSHELKGVSREVNTLNVGTAYVCLAEKLAKVKFAFAKDLSEYFGYIKNKCNSHENRDRYSCIKTKVVGETSKLLLDTEITEFWNNGNISNYHAIISNPPSSSKSRNSQTAVIGENSYSLETLSLDFSSGTPSGTLILGSSKKVGASIIKSIVKSLRTAKNNLYVFNLDKSTDYAIPCKLESGDNPLTCYCQTYSKIKGTLLLESQAQFDARFECIYKEYLIRKEIDRNSSKRENFTPIYLFINHISKLNDFFLKQTLFSTQNGTVAQNVPQSTPNKDNDRYKELMNESLDELTALFKKGTQTLQATKAAIETPNISIEAAPIKAALALYELLEHGYQYSIHIVISLFDKAWNEGFANRFKRVIAFNDMSKADMPTSLIKQYKLDNMLKSIRNNDEEETRALLVIQDSVTKLRPVIYEMTKYEIDMENLK